MYIKLHHTAVKINDNLVLLCNGNMLHRELYNMPIDRIIHNAEPFWCYLLHKYFCISNTNLTFEAN